VNSFLEQLWGEAMRGAALDDAFWDQLSGRSFGKPLWELAFGSNCSSYLVGFSIGSDLYY
jgi:hypothetical protein